MLPLPCYLYRVAFIMLPSSCCLCVDLQRCRNRRRNVPPGDRFAINLIDEYVDLPCIAFVIEGRWDRVLVWLHCCVACFSLHTRNGLIPSGTGGWSAPRRPLSGLWRPRFRLPLRTTDLRELQRFVLVYLFINIFLFIYGTYYAPEHSESESGARDYYVQTTCPGLLCRVCPAISNLQLLDYRPSSLQKRVNRPLWCYIYMVPMSDMISMS